MNSKQQQQGFTLLELVLMLVIVAIMSVGILHYFHYQRWQRNVDQVQQSVQQVLYASNSYFHAQCGQWIFPFNPRTVTEQQLVDAGLLANKALVKNPWGDLFTISIDGRQRPVLLKVSAKMDKLPGVNPSNDYYAKLLGATANNNELTWTMTVTAEVDKVHSNLWLMGHSLRNFKKALGDDSTSNACLG